MKWSSSAWASAEPSVGSVPAPSSSSRTSVPGPAASTIRVIERRWPENVERRLGDRLLVADVGEDVAQDRQARAGRGRHVEPGLVHEREQAERPQRHGLAAGVRTGDDERRVAVAEPDVDRDHAAGEARVAGAEQDDLGPVGGLGPDPVHLGGELGLGRPEVEPGQRVERLAELLRVGGDERRQLVEDPLDLLALGRLRLAPGVAELDRHDAARRTASGRCRTRRGRCP